MTIFDHFGILAPYYDRVFKPGDRDWLFNLIDLPVPGAILDAGGGTGRIAQLLHGQASHVVVADLSFEMLQQANHKGELGTTCAHTEKLPFPNDYFDRVIMIDALHHVCDQPETARDLWRVLKPGGQVVIEEPDIRTFGIKLLALGEKLLGMRSHFLSPPQIAALFDQSAETNIEIKGLISWIIVRKPVS